jgi:hypothetical protein
MAVSSAGLYPRVTALTRPRSNCTVNYRPVLSSERALQNNKAATVWRKYQGKEKLFAGPRRAPDTRTDWPTDCRSYINFNFNFNLGAAKMEPIARGYNWATLFLGDINTRDLAFQVGGVSGKTVKYDREFCGTSTQAWLLWQGPEAIVQ